MERERRDEGGESKKGKRMKKGRLGVEREKGRSTTAMKKIHFPVFAFPFWSLSLFFLSLLSHEN